MLHLTVELVLKSYMPKELEVGMWFITKINQDTPKEYIEVWALDKLPQEPFDEFITKNGAPVEPYLIYDEDVVAEPHEIGWWDDGPVSDELRDITLAEVNHILIEWDGMVDVEIDEHSYAHYEEIEFVFYEDKMVLSVPGTYEDEDDDEDEFWDDMDDDS